MAKLRFGGITTVFRAVAQETDGDLADVRGDSRQAEGEQ
jgi:hypothetical protein